MANVDNISEHGISVAVDIAHYLVSAIGVLFFADDGLTGYLQLLAGAVAIYPIMWPYGEMMGFDLPFWGDFWSHPLRTIGETYVFGSCSLVYLY